MEFATSLSGPPGGRIVREKTPIEYALAGADARDEFLRAWPWLEAAIQAYADTHHEEHVWAKIEDGQAQLWTTPRSAFVSEIRVWPTGMKEAVAWLAGGEADELLMLKPAFEAWAKSKNCKRVGFALGRKGWERVLKDYRVAGITLMKEL